jgi:hypothetical protein
MSTEKIFPKDLIQSAAEQLRQEFKEIQLNNPHAAEGGAEAEIILMEFFKDRLPRRFGIESGIVIGSDGAVSKQTDLIIYDALNSPVYRKGPKVHILPRDNVAAIIEVKSKLNKDQLKDAAEKISSVKRIKPSPISNVDQPVTFSDLIIANTLGCVFAYDSYTSLETLAENLKEINEQYESDCWIDLVVVLDKGIISYAVQLPFGKTFPGWFGGPAVDEFPVCPIYIHLIKQETRELSLNHFYLKLMAHLTFFRKRTSIDFQGILGQQPSEVMTIQGYQYNLKRHLVPVEESHQEGKFKNPQVRFNLYSKKDRVLLGQTCYWPWQDGAVITCSARFDPRIVFRHYFSKFKQKGVFLQAGTADNLWFSSLIAVSEKDFIEASKEIHKDLISVQDTNDDNPPPFKI